jgi:hypothetical protein
MLDLRWNTVATDIHKYVNTTNSSSGIHINSTEVVIGVMYISVSLLSNIVEILELGKKAAVMNNDNKITGFLVYQSPYFCQYIEGNKHTVDALLTLISNDYRHVSMRIIENCTYTNRKYPDWDMEVMIYKTIGLDHVIKKV